MKSMKWLAVLVVSIALGIGVSGLMPGDIQARDAYSGCPSPMCAVANYVSCTSGGCSQYWPYSCNDCDEDQYYCHVIWHRFDTKYRLCRKCYETYGCFDEIPYGGPNPFIP